MIAVVKTLKLAVGMAVLSGAVGDVLHATQHGILGVGATITAVVAIWLWVVRPLRHFLHEARVAHDVLIGHGGEPGIRERLKQNGEWMVQIEKASSRTARSVTRIEGRVNRVEKSLDVLKDAEANQVRGLLADAGRETRRRKAAS